MSLTSGTRLGPYEIVAPLGAGGMGEVYRAKDTKLNRDVAIKVLPESFALDADRVARFTREAQVLASLNHPNIAAIYGIEEQGSTRALVMELVEGEDLSALIAADGAFKSQGALRTGLVLSDALAIARQIADALEVAHEQGIVHRDLKPQNIKVRADGTVKVLDFGLAKAMDPAATSSADAMNSPTMTARATQMGMIIGTAAYMAPEQARGKAVDRRADIWAFGVMLYEMLTGRRAFEGEEITDVLAAVLRQDIDWTALPPATPPRLRALLERLLERDPKQRLRDIGEARVELAKLQSGAPDSAPAVPAVATVSRLRAVAVALPWVIAVGALGVAGWAYATSGRSATNSGTGSISRLQIAMPPGIDLYAAVGMSFSLAPDGRTFAFVGIRGGVRQVYLRRFDSNDVTPVRGSEGAVSVTMSPDGRELLFGAADTSLRRIRLSDELVTLAVKSVSGYVGAWLKDGRIAYAADGRLWAAPGTPGGAPTALTDAGGGASRIDSNPVRVPGTDALAFISGPLEDVDSIRIDVVNLADGTRKTIVERAFGPIFTSTGHLLFVRGDDLFAVKFDSQALEVIGSPVRVLTGLTVIRTRGLAPLLSVAENGTAVFTAANDTQSELVRVTREGAEEVLLRMDRPAGNPRISPDGQRVITEGIGQGLWQFDPQRRIESRMTDRTVMASFPVFDLNGREVIYRSTQAMLRQPLDGSTRSTAIPGTGANQMPSSVTRDGTKLLYIFIDPVTSGDIYEIPIAGGSPRAVVKTNAYEGGAQVSPDGKWIVYVSNELGPNEIFLQSYPTADRRVQVSSTGGIHPMWNPKGGEIFYRRGDDMMSVPVTFGGAGPVLAPPVKLFTGRYSFGGGLTIANYSVTPDGHHFLMIKDQPRAIFNVVLNWLDEVKAAVK